MYPQPAAVAKIIDGGINYPQNPQQGCGRQQAAQPAEFEQGPVHQHGLQPAIKVLNKPKGKLQVSDDRNKYQQLQYRVQQNDLLQQHRDKLQQVRSSKAMLRSR